MKILLSCLLLVSVFGCASGSREVASVKNHCEIEKHPKKNWYRLKMHGQPMNKTWYKKHEAEAFYSKYDSAGRCEY